MDITHTQASVAGIECDLLVIGVRAGATPGAEAGIEPALVEALREAARLEEHEGKVGSITSWPALGRVAAQRLALVGLGQGSPDELRRAAGAGTYLGRSKGAGSIVLAFGDLDAAQTLAVLEGAEAGAYRYDRYKAEDARKPEPHSLALAGKVDLSTLALAQAIAAGTRLTRDLVNGPAAEVYPETLAEQALAMAGDGLSVEVWDEQRIRSEGMGGITAVGQGSTRPARFVHMRWIPPGKPRKRLALVGKGVTFDSGGLSLKPSNSMQTMRCDMAGAGAVLGAMEIVRRLRPDVEVHGIFGAVENMNDGNSYKLGDILRMYNGKTVEIHNTDAEGRLVLADCLTYADRLGCDAIVDLATLTGAAVVALGSEYVALYSPDDALAQALLRSAEQAGEGLWRMPLPDSYKELLKAEWGTMKNVGGPEAGSITAALFLKEFVEATPWAHLDIAGPAFRERAWRHLAPGASGSMVPTLARWLLA